MDSRVGRLGLQALSREQALELLLDILDAPRVVERHLRDDLAAQLLSLTPRVLPHLVHAPVPLNARRRRLRGLIPFVVLHERRVLARDQAGASDARVSL